jgi:hypothetical protein
MPRIVTVLQRPGVFAAFLVVCGSFRLLPVIWDLVFWPYYGQTGAIAVNTIFTHYPDSKLRFVPPRQFSQASKKWFCAHDPVAISPLEALPEEL